MLHGVVGPETVSSDKDMPAVPPRFDPPRAMVASAAVLALEFVNVLETQMIMRLLALVGVMFAVSDVV